MDANEPIEPHLQELKRGPIERAALRSAGLRDDAGTYRVLIDTAHLEQLVQRALKSKGGASIAGPLQVRVYQARRHLVELPELKVRSCGCCGNAGKRQSVYLCPRRCLCHLHGNSQP